MCNCDNPDHSHDRPDMTRRAALRGGVAATAAAASVAVGAQAANAQADNPYAPPAEPALPPSTMKLTCRAQHWL